MHKRFASLLFSLPVLFSAVPAAAGGGALLDLPRTALVVTDPQNDFLHENGKLYGLLKENLDRLGTVANLDRLMRAARQAGVLLAVDPLVLDPQDAEWRQPGALQKQLLELGALRRDGSGNGGGDFYAPFLPYIESEGTVVASAHKLYGPESNDLIYQLRSRGVDTVVLAGLVANLCVDSHLRALMENGFRVYVVADAVAAPGEEAYQAALVNYRMIANGVLTTEEAVTALRR